MMTRLQYLLLKAGEEASEITKIASKNQQFGLNEVRKDQFYTNRERMHNELDDLNTIIYLLNKEFGFNYIPNKNARRVKINKVERYYKISKKLGLVE